jgi:hypothetical protein
MKVGLRPLQISLLETATVVDIDHGRITAGITSAMMIAMVIDVKMIDVKMIGVMMIALASSTTISRAVEEDVRQQEEAVAAVMVAAVHLHGLTPSVKFATGKDTLPKTVGIRVKTMVVMTLKIYMLMA